MVLFLKSENPKYGDLLWIKVKDEDSQKSIRETLESRIGNQTNLFSL